VRHNLNIESLEAYLRANVSKFGTRIVEMKQFEGGQSNPTYYVKDDKGSEFVLRKKPPGKLLPSAV
jgi:aminoglycoside phosphotransferase (APT) family kinase protein